MKEQDFLELPKIDFDEALETIIEDNRNTEGKDKSQRECETMSGKILDSLPKLNYRKLKEEISQMSVPMSKNPTTFELNEGLERTQAYKSRLAEILNYATEDYVIKKRCIELLRGNVMLNSKGSSADKRENEANAKYFTHLIQLDASKLFMETVELAMSQMKSMGDAISRQVSVMSIQLSIGELTHRKNFNQNEENVDYHSGVKELDWEK